MSTEVSGGSLFRWISMFGLRIALKRLVAVEFKITH